MTPLKNFFSIVVLSLLLGCGDEDLLPIVYPECTITFPEFEPFSLCSDDPVFPGLYCEIEDGGEEYLLEKSRTFIPQFCLDEGLFLPYVNDSKEIIELEITKTRHSRGARVNVINSIECPIESQYYGFCITGETIKVVLENDKKNIVYEIYVSTTLQDNEKAFSDQLIIEREIADREYVSDMIIILDRRQSSQNSSSSLEFTSTIVLNGRTFLNVYSDQLFGSMVFYNKDYGLIGFEYQNELWVLQNF